MFVIIAYETKFSFFNLTCEIISFAQFFETGFLLVGTVLILSVIYFCIRYGDSNLRVVFR